MDNQNHLKLRISRMLRSSFGSCRTRNFTDIMEKAVSTPAPRKISGQRKNDQSSEMGVLPLHEIGKVKDTFAVVKHSSDPYNDFRTSMVEMIIEKQIFSLRDLKNLLQCFLSHHHNTIVEVFTEIREALFFEWL
ncbi:unnamed protein product [Lupinus luteus]|uniref:Transcription repressor n=1 Tax=Lupinus luteus TaxID=3873 RepID=A0AAV1WWT8_LUPLU